MRLGFLHIRHRPCEERHHVGVQPAHIVGGLAVVKILDVQVGGVVGILLIHTAFDGEPCGERDGGDEPVFRILERIIREVAVQSRVPQSGAFGDGADVTRTHQVVLFHLFHIPVMTYPVLAREEVQIPQFRLVNNRHAASNHPNRIHLQA